MKLCCKTCKCDVCGNIHECEILYNKIEEIDTGKNHKCVPILSCNMFTLQKDYNIHTDWKCEVKKLVKKGELS